MGRIEEGPEKMITFSDPIHINNSDFGKSSLRFRAGFYPPGINVPQIQGRLSQYHRGFFCVVNEDFAQKIWKSQYLFLYLQQNKSQRDGSSMLQHNSMNIKT